jgi:hypothetical protein
MPDIEGHQANGRLENANKKETAESKRQPGRGRMASGCCGGTGVAWWMSTRRVDADAPQGK